MPEEAYMAIQVGGHRANSQRFAALIDVADAETVGSYSWHMNSQGYAARMTQVGDKRLVVRMHRVLLGLGLGDPREVDHINGDTLDNRRANLRVCTHGENLQNRHERPYRGAYWHAQNHYWTAKVMLDGKSRHLGCFATREEAAAVAAAFRRQHMPFSSDARDADGA